MSGDFVPKKWSDGTSCTCTVSNNTVDIRSLDAAQLNRTMASSLKEQLQAIPSGGSFESPPEGLCDECGQGLADGYPIMRQGRHLPPDKWAHFECYVDRCAQKALERLAR